MGAPEEINIVHDIIACNYLGVDIEVVKLAIGSCAIIIDP